MELIIPSDDSKKPMYEQIYEYIKNEIKTAKLHKGEKLPSTRKLAADLKLSRSTIQLAYEQLEAEGYIEAFPSRGYFVSGFEELYNLTASDKFDRHSPDFKLSDFNNPHNESRLKDKNGIDFSPRGIDFSVFPYTVWRKLSKDTFIDDNTQMFSSGDNRGELLLREAVSNYLHRARAVDAAAVRIIIGAGNEYLMLILGLMFGKLNIALENPTYKQAYRVFNSLGWEVSAVGMDDSGMKSSDLRKSGAEIAYTMPSHQYPTGVIMSASRRREIINWAMEAEDRYIIEDDYDSEFRYKGRPIPAMQGMGGSEKVIYIGTFSKAIAPAIRVSFMLLPEKLMHLYQNKAGFLSCTVPRPDQNILYHFIADGYFERHLNKMRKIYKAKHDAFFEELKLFSEKFDIIGANAGLHLMLKSKSGETALQLAKLAAGKGVKVYPIDNFFIETFKNTNTFNTKIFDTVSSAKNKISDTVILGYATLSTKEIKKGIALLKKAWL